MRHAIIHSVAGFLVLAAPSVAFAECTIGDAKTEQELAKIEGIRSGDYGTIRRDMRSLRSAAVVLNRYGKDEACTEVVAAINEMLRNPKAASDLRNKSMNSATMAEAPAKAETTATKTTETTTTEPAAADSTATATTEPAAADSTAATTTETAATTTETTTSETTTAQKTDATANTPPVMTMDERRKGAVALTERKNAMSAAELIGSDVYGPDNSSIGEIDDIVVGTDNVPAYALLSYGGFLGMGEEQAAVPVSEIRVSDDNYYFVDFNAEQLQAAPRLKRGTSDWWSNASWRTENETYYNSVN